MKIYYRRRANDPYEGDVKVLKSGKVFVRWQLRHDGCYVVSNGRPVFDWIPIEQVKNEEGNKYFNFATKSALEMIERSGYSEFHESHPRSKTRSVRLNMQTESGRKEFTRLTGIDSANSTLTSCTLTMQS